MGWDSNPRYPCGHAGFQDRCLKPLGHPSTSTHSKTWNSLAENKAERWRVCRSVRHPVQPCRWGRSAASSRSTASCCTPGSAKFLFSWRGLSGVRAPDARPSRRGSFPVRRNLASARDSRSIPTGEGDLYASGFPYALIRVVPLPICGETGSLCAAEIICHLGGRPEVDLSQLLADAGGLMMPRPAVRG